MKGAVFCCLLAKGSLGPGSPPTVYTRPMIRVKLPKQLALPSKLASNAK
jgi:hypothetical protein